MEPPSSSRTFSNSGLSEQHQQPGNAQSSGQAHSVSSKPFGQGGRRADAKAPPPVTLQARTGVLPFLGNAQPPAEVTAQSGQRSWWQLRGSAVVQEAVKVCASAVCCTASLQLSVNRKGHLHRAPAGLCTASPVLTSMALQYGLTHCLSITCLAVLICHTPAKLQAS